MITDKQMVVEANYSAFPVGKIPNKFLITHASVGGKKLRYPLFDLHKWYLETTPKFERLLHYSKNSTRLNRALELFGNLDLEKSTLLDQETHNRHAKNLYRRLLRQFGKTLITIEPRNKVHKFGIPAGSAYFESPDHQRARQLIRFITVIHCVEALDVGVALSKAQELMSEVKEYVLKMPGAACTGTVEIEINSIKQTKRNRDFKAANIRNNNVSNIDDDGVMSFHDDGNNIQYIKLDGCEILSSHLTDEEINGENGQFIIHFHGVLVVSKPEDINALNEIFLQNPNWNRAKRQVLFKSFNRLWRGKHKTIERSLEDIAFYITKGGRFKHGNSCSLQYNIDLSKGISTSYDEYLNLSDRYHSPKRQVLIDQGDMRDLLILSHHEINALALVVHEMMKWNKSGTGYVVSVGW